MKNSNELFTRLRPYIVQGAIVRMHPDDFRDLKASARRKFTSFVSTRNKAEFLWSKLKIVVDPTVEYGKEILVSIDLPEVPA